MPIPPINETETSFERKLAMELLSIGAVSFRPDNPFTWASGLRSPVYCDNRLTISHPSVRRLITDGFMRVIADRSYRPAAIAGTATAGIPHAAWLAERLDLPMVYVRSRAKTHGTARRTEGRLNEGSDVVLVEDLVSTGMSSLDAAKALESEGARVIAVLAIFSYGLLNADEAFKKAAIPLHALTSFPALIEAASALGQLDARAGESIEDWRRDPEAWSRKFA